MMVVFNRISTLFGAGLFILVVAGCGGRQETSNQSGGPVPADTAAPTATTPQATSEVKTYTFHGTPTKIDEATNTITINHEKIGDYMEAMTMPYKVADPALLKKATVGKETHFTLRVAGDQALIVDISDKHAEGEQH